MGKIRPRDQRLDVAKEMPPLYRTLPGQGYSHGTDAVLQWISRRPGLLNYMFDKLKFSGYVVYDPETHTWSGIDYEQDDA